MDETQEGSEAVEQQQEASALVVVGASAGGVDAVLTLLASLPPDFPAPIVVAQHLDPHRPSHLHKIFAGRSPLPVRTATEFERLRPGTVYVVPADRDVEISNHHVGIRRDTEGFSKPSVDRLMASAARVFGENLIGVVLTGTGADGAAGAQAIKAYGGTVVIQNPSTARFAGMPAAVPPSAVDVVADLTAIGPLLVDLVTGRYPLPQAGEDGELRPFLERIRDRTGLDFAAYKRPTIERRLQRRMAAVGTTSLSDYHRYVERHPEEVQRLVASFLIKVTRFFRDPELFAHLRDHVLPTLTAQARERGDLRLWSAGCATGEEAYSLAMLVADLLGDDLNALPVRIFATDVAAEAVDFARRGVYPEAAVTDVPRDLVERHFVRFDGAYEVRKPVRGLVVFGEHDLGNRAPFPRTDLVLCRNVLIYFTPELQRRALQLFAFSLRPSGYLALGTAESVSPLPEYFALEQPRLKLFRRVGTAAPIPADRVLDAAPLGGAGARPPRRPPVRGPAPHVPQPSLATTLADQAARVLDALSVGVVTVDRNYDIRTINVAARRLLGVRGAGLGEDLIHRAAPALAGPLRVAVDGAFRGEATTAVHRLPQDVVEDGGRDVAIACFPAPSDDAGAPVDAVVVEVAEVTAFAQRQRDLEAERARLHAEWDGLRDRAAAAIAEVRELRAANEAMAAELGRLRVENEQLQLAHEEAQAAAEEIETLNEEQQATNEELETLNEELQATVEELNATNEDLQARTFELQELATSLEAQRRESEAERARLQAILGNMGDAVLVVDAEGGVVQTNAAWDRLFGATADIAAEDEEGRPLPPEARPQARAARGEAFTATFTLSGPAGVRRWFEASAQPVQGDDGAQWGVVVVRDITERSLRRLQQQFLAVAAHELRTPLTALSGTLQLLARRLRRAEAEDRLQDLAERSLDQARRLDAIVGDLMDVARLQGGPLRLDRGPLDLAAFVRGAAETAQPLAAGQQIVVDSPDGPVPVNGDARRLEQVLLNALTNAITYAPDADRIDVRLRRAGGEAAIEVQDYGPGIPAEALPDVFARFYRLGERRSASEGLGLGLYIAREIVTAHGGTIEARSTVGEGTTIEIRLPLLAGDDSDTGTGNGPPATDSPAASRTE